MQERYKRYKSLPWLKLKLTNIHCGEIIKNLSQRKIYFLNHWRGFFVIKVKVAIYGMCEIKHKKLKIKLTCIFPVQPHLILIIVFGTISSLNIFSLFCCIFFLMFHVHITCTERPGFYLTLLLRLAWVTRWSCLSPCWWATPSSSRSTPSSQTAS